MTEHRPIILEGLRRRPAPLVAMALLATCAALTVALPPPAAAAVPAGFTDTVLIGDLRLPTNLAFAPDGRMFVTEKRGLLKVYDSPTDTTAEVVADLRTDVWNHSDSGLNGLAVDPQFPTRPYVYVSYAYDAPPGGKAPTWGTAGADDDDCSVSGVEHCVTQGRVVRLTLSGNRVVAQNVLLQASCHPFSSHSINEVQFGPDGMLYVTTGDAAGGTFADYGQKGNKCADPPVPAGSVPQASTSEAGSLRSQDLRTSGDPVGLNGTIVRIHPDTGAPATGNPLLSHADPNARRIIAHGLRNPFRFAFRPGSQDVYIGDVGWNNYEEIDRVADVDDGVVENFGWPCYEGANRQGSWDALNNNICEKLYSEGSAVSPLYAYPHNDKFLSTGACPDKDAGTIGGLRFYPGGSFPDSYDGALFFVDFSRGCLMVMKPGSDGRPQPSTLTEFSTTTPWAVDLEVGPGGDLYYLDIYSGDLHRIRYSSSNKPPTAAVTASPTSGPVGTTVRFDASGSRDPEGSTLTYAWDLDGDGALDDATGVTASRTYNTAGSTTVTVEARDPSGATARASTSVLIGGAAPTPVITAAAGSQTWATGEPLVFNGTAKDSTGATLPASALKWSSTLFHCESSGGCHPHPLSGGTGSSLSFTGPDHSAPAYIDVTLTATDSRGVTGTTTLRADPETVALTLASNPSGLQVAFDAEVAKTPFTRTVIVGSQHTVSAAEQSTSTGTWRFRSWSDGGAATHTLTGPKSATTLTATFESAGGTANLLTNGNLATGSPLPTCFTLSRWGTNTASGELSSDLPAGATGRSYTVKVSGYSNGDAKLLPSTSSGCGATVQPGGSYSVGLSYKATSTRNSLIAYTFNGTRWVYWTKLDSFPAASSWTQVSRALPPVPTGVTRVAFAMATEANGSTSVAGLTLGAPAPPPPPPAENLLANGNLATGSPLPTCFTFNRWGTLTASGTLSNDVPAGATGRSYAITVSGYSSGDAKLLPSPATGCGATVQAGTSYTVGLSYKATSAKNSLIAYTHTGSGWKYWTTLSSLPAASSWTSVSRSLPALPAGTTRVAFALAVKSDGTASVADLGLRKAG
ncbi:glucose/arabinose dehydrogenase [Kineococcus xinjiangensis]|uniref:Glucose/arabinose dehydrogenase n=1 Tax=Kineococcus xinjiangensis TaxID=512762 RepID=A0A2S6ITD3_9ACTN|nr:PQQ-dependent sugar dehydrogenase [Kineococcus xinjiangensis]PPK97306.1 glucose/arabinose dehydrogenase [Kineococcus xinjiangensis]